MAILVSWRAVGGLVGQSQTTLAQLLFLPGLLGVLLIKHKLMICFVAVDTPDLHCLYPWCRGCWI